MPSNKTLVLLTEDVCLIGATLADELEDAGFEVAGPFDRCRDAEKWLQSARPDCAVLEIRLLDGDCTILDAELVRRHIPVVVFSGFQEHACRVPIAATVWLEKPALPGTLAASVRTVTS
jgi:DNA-binding response OmpR family regulator